MCYNEDKERVVSYNCNYLSLCASYAELLMSRIPIDSLFLEIGLLEQSPYLPLKVLHKLLDGIEKVFDC
jgi:hypothetical protein